MKAGYTIRHDEDTPSYEVIAITVDNYPLQNLVVTRMCNEELLPMVLDDFTVAILRIVKCDDCGKVAKLKHDASGNGDRICQSCEDNRNEAAAERYANDAESFSNQDYSQYKSLK